VAKKKPRIVTAPLTGKHKSYLRALAHSLKPVVQIGHQGLTAGVLAGLDVALERHELLKVKVSGDAEVEAEDLGPEIEQRTGCRVAQIIGHTLVLYRRRQENPKIVLPRAKPGRNAAAPARVAADPDHEGDDEGDDLE
jgi:RNA-binding protein